MATVHPGHQESDATEGHLALMHAQRNTMWEENSLGMTVFGELLAAVRPLFYLWEFSVKPFSSV